MWKVFLMMNRKVVISLAVACLLLFTSACARTVTEKDLRELSLQFSIDFASSPTSAYSVYLIFSSGSDDILYPNNVAADYFVAPGQDFDPTEVVLYSPEGNGLSDYYDSYFGTWENYILIHNDEALLYPGPFSDVNDHDDYSIYSSDFEESNAQSGRTLSFEIPISELGLDEGDTLSFQIVTIINDEDTKSGYLEDALQDEGQIDIYDQESNSDEVAGTSPYDPDNAAEIESWSVDVN